MTTGPEYEYTETGSLFSRFNIIAGIIVLVGLWLTYRRFTGGLSAVTNLDHNNPWGLWIGFDVFCGVALAAGGYTTAAAVEIFGMKKYRAALRPAILTGFLGYLMVVIALVYDVCRPWRLPYPFFVSQGVTSVMFEVGVCVLLYLIVLFLEFSPIPLEWFGAKRLRRVILRLTLLLSVLGVLLSNLHQSSLGALFLLPLPNCTLSGTLHTCLYFSLYPALRPDFQWSYSKACLHTETLLTG